MKLFYRELGKGNPIIILHGIFGSSDNWLTVGKKLSEKNKIYLVDQRNHGQSFHSKIFNYQVMAQDIKDFMEDHLIKKVILIGHSMGGKVAMNFAISYPEKLIKLVIVDIAPKVYKVHHENILKGLSSMNLATIQSRKMADEYLANYVPEIEVRQFLLKNLARNDIGKFKWKLNLNAIKKNVKLMGDELDTDNSFNGPTLFIRGGNSNYITEGDKSSFKNYFKNSSLITIPNSGHWVHAEQPEKFMVVVNKFITEN